MRIGVICEGPTDFPAIQSFFKHSLSQQGIQAEFVPLQPLGDNTQGGWTQVLYWLDRNPPAIRIQDYFKGELFDEEPQLDCLLIHMDSDILDDDSFKVHVKNKYQYAVKNLRSADDRGDEIRAIINRAAQFSEMPEAIEQRHVLAPAVESTEAWCVAAFTRRKKDFEALSGPQLADAFMQALERSESRKPEQSYTNIDKSISRRERFCEAYAEHSGRVIRGCPQFEKIYRQLLEVGSGPAS